MDPDQDLLDKFDRKEGLNGPLPIALGIATAGLAGAVAYFTLKLEFNVPTDAAVDVTALVLIGCVALLTARHPRFS